MSYPISSMIGIRTGGVFSGSTDITDLKRRTVDIINEMNAEDGFLVDINPDRLDKCMSAELSATKGDYVVIAGVFNYWDYKNTSEFARRLSKEFKTEVMVMTLDEKKDSINCNVFLGGEVLAEVFENEIERTLRRM